MPIKKELRRFYRGPAWQATRARIRERAGDRCEHCHSRNGARGYRGRKHRFVEAVGQRIPMAAKIILIQCGCAHLNGVAGDDRDENLAWLCRRCHLLHDKPQHRDTRATHKDALRPLLQEMTA